MSLIGLFSRFMVHFCVPIANNAIKKIVWRSPSEGNETKRAESKSCHASS